MYYELYIDKFFLENMILDYLLLLAVRRVIRCKAPWWRLLLASIFGAAGMCVMIILPIQNTWIYNICGFGILSIGMLKIGCKIKERNTLIRGVLVLYLTAFILGGIWEMILSHIAATGLLLGIISYLTLRLILNCYQKYKMKTEYLYDVTIYINGKSKHVLGFCDTGNQLKQPFTGKPVSIIDFDSISEILEDDMKQQLLKMYQFQNGEITTDKISYIPYHSIGEKNGLLPGLKLDYMSVQRQSFTQVIGSAIVAVTKESVSAKGEYQMILNPSIIES